MKPFPVLQGDTIKSVPWEFIEPHERQAQRNHYQTLDRLAARGGLSPCEMLAVVEGRKWHAMLDGEAKLQVALDKWQADMERAHGVCDVSPKRDGQ